MFDLAPQIAEQARSPAVGAVVLTEVFETAQFVERIIVENQRRWNETADGAVVIIP